MYISLEFDKINEIKSFGLISFSNIYEWIADLLSKLNINLFIF